MRTKLPTELEAGDRLAMDGGVTHGSAPLTVVAFAYDPPRAPLVLLFHDGSMVEVTDLTVPVELAP